MFMNYKRVFRIYIVIVLLIASATFAVALTTPYSLSGKIYDSDGTTPIVGANITFTNQNSSEVIYYDSTSGGEYQQDAANFPSGYYDGDSIQYYTTYNTQNNTTTAAIAVSGGGTSLDIVLSAGPIPTPTLVPAAGDTANAISSLSSMLMFLVLLLIDFGILFFVFKDVRDVFYADSEITIGSIVFPFLGFTLSFILAKRSLIAPIEMAELNYFLMSIAIVMLLVLVRCVLQFVINAISALKARDY